MGLFKYFAKRKFDKTPEPHGKLKRSASKELIFVIHKHHASQLHYDLRLELDGVLKSWAVPKGPSTNPHDKHLAVQVEDHPFEYRTFEGVIPEDNYGAGEVIIWDQGTYEPRADSNDYQKTLRQELKKGHLTFVLHGEKLKGEYALIKLHGKDKKAWLLIKKNDEFASVADITKQDESVVSGQTVEDLEEAPHDLSDYPTAEPPAQVIPMLSTLVDAPFNQEGWLFEIKWDGYRAIGTKQKNKVSLFSRNQLDFRPKFPEVAEALHSLKDDVVLDGEIVAIDDAGKPHFEWLQNWGRIHEGELRYFVFDILWYNRRDVRTMPLIERKKLLRSVIPKDNSILAYSDHVEQDGEKLFKAIQKQGLEGIMAKKATSEYHQNVRSGNWLKIKTHLRQEVIICGFTEGRGSRTYIGALILGIYDKDDLIYVGHTNAGMPDKERMLLRQKLDKLERQSPPFATAPKPNAPVHWVRPSLVCEVEFSEWTKEGSMRQPEFKGLRNDKDPKEVKREKARKKSAAPSQAADHKEAQAESPGPLADKSYSPDLHFTHLDKPFFPERGYTKGDLIHYYESVADYILPYLVDRPMSMLRQPDGYKDHGFFQKDITFHLPKFAKTFTVFSESTKEDVHFLLCNNIETLLYMVQLGSIEVNPWSSTTKRPEHPDWAVMDLDPEGVKFSDVVKVAKTVHEVCDEWKVPTYPKTSGKTGIHIFIPLGGKYNYGQARDLVHLIALEVNKRQPKLTSVERSPKLRRHRIYLDYLQNSKGQTLAAPYSARPTKEASVSTPLHWSEVNASLDPAKFTIKNTVQRLHRTGDLWEDVLHKSVDIKKLLQRL